MERGVAKILIDSANSACSEPSVASWRTPVYNEIPSIFRIFTNLALHRHHGVA
jgi:hypothetical protein